MSASAPGFEVVFRRLAILAAIPAAHPRRTVASRVSAFVSHLSHRWESLRFNHDSSPVRTTALMAAFIPAASPPLVNTAMRFISTASPN